MRRRRRRNNKKMRRRRETIEYICRGRHQRG